MGSQAIAPVTYETYMLLPDPENAHRLELHDGEVVEVPPARPRHRFIQLRLLELLSFVQKFDKNVVMEHPYRPAPNYQFWFADVAVITSAAQDALFDSDTYETSAPLLIIEVMSPSNTQKKMARQRDVAMAQGTEAFWIIDANLQTVKVTTREGMTEYRIGDSIAVPGCPGRTVSVAAIFARQL